MARNRPFDGRDFGDLVESGCGFEDRTWIICDQYRGRRDPSEAPGFGNVPGEPMDLGMLDAFFNLKYKGNTWFEGLEASRCGGCDEDKNAHPVIRLSFDGIEGPYEEFVSAVRRWISDLFREHLDDLDGRISENDMNAVMDFIDEKPTHLLFLGPLNILASLLYKTTAKRPL